MHFLPRTYRLKKNRYVTVAVLLAVAVIFFLQKVVLTRVVEVILPSLAASADWDVHWDRLQAGLFVPISMEGVRIRTLSPNGGKTSFNASKVVVEISTIWNWWKGRERLFSKLQVEGLEGVLDFRSPSSNKFLKALFKDKFRYQLMAFPLALDIQASDFNLLFDGVTYRLRNFLANLNEDSLGKIQYSFAKVETPAFEKKLPASSALATWKLGILSLVRWPVLPDCTIERMNINFLKPEGLGVDFDMTAFGGTVKGSLTRKVHEVRPYWDAALVAQRMELAPLAKALEVQAPIRGILKEGKLTFRGKLSNIADAEASVHVSAEGFRWNELGWQSLEFGADLINHRIAIPEFHLRQKENSLHLNGSASIPKDLRDFSKTPFEISMVGDIQDLAALAGLLGPKFYPLHGRMTLDGSLWSGKDGPNGYFKLEASSIRFQEAQFTSARVNTVVRNGNAEITSCELWNGEDFLLGQGTVDLNALHQYSGTISLRARDIGIYRSLVGENWQGALGLTWQGDGTFKRHSGAFTVDMENFVSKWTPNGVSGKLVGTFSPGYISFNRFELFRDALRLTTQMSLSPFGVKINDFRIHKGGTQLSEGSGFLPVDLFAFASGTSWKKTLHSEEPVFLDLNSRKMEIADLCRLTGQNRSLSGLIQLRLFMRGEASALKLSGQFSGDNFRGMWNGQKIPSSKVQMKMEAAQGIANFSTSLVSQKMGEIRGHASVPLTSEKTFANLLNFSGPMQGALQIENLDVALLKNFFPGISKLAGKGSADLTFKNTLSDPKVDGQLALSQGILEIVPQVPAFSDFQMMVKILENRISLNIFHGKLGTGNFSIAGGVEFFEWNKPQINLQFSGDKVILYQDPSLTLQANVHLRAQGPWDSGKISGAIRLQNSELRRHLEILFPSSNSAQAEQIFSWEKKVPSMFVPWGLDVSISNEGPFLVKGKLTHGEIIPSLHLGGSLGNVLPSGSIGFKNLRGFFPFAIVEIPEGSILFDSKYPREPILDTHGFVEAAGFALQITATGPLAHPSFFFASDPPLCPHLISLLLFTGLSPWQDNMKLPSSLSQIVFPLQMLRTFTKTPPLQGTKPQIDNTPTNMFLFSAPSEVLGIALELFCDTEK